MNKFIQYSKDKYINLRFVDFVWKSTNGWQLSMATPAEGTLTVEPEFVDAFLSACGIPF